MCVNLLMLQVLLLSPSVSCYHHLLTPPAHARTHKHSFLVWCVWMSMCLCSIISVSSSLCKCQGKLLLFPDHAVGDGPTSLPWQPSVLAQRKGKDREERNFYASKPPLAPSSLCIVAQLFTMWPSSQASLRPQRRKRRVLQLLRRWWGTSGWMLLKY